VDWVNTLGLERTTLGRWFHTLEERFQIKAISLLFLFSFSLSLLLFVDFDLSFTVRAGEVAPRDVKSPVSIDIIDVAATEEQKKRAEASVISVYDFDRDANDERLRQVYQAFRKMREELRSVQLPRDEIERSGRVLQLFELKPVFERSLGVTVSDPVFEWLLLQRFSSRIETSLVLQIEAWSRSKVVNGLDRAGHSGDEIRLRDVTKGTSSGGRETTLPSKSLRDVQRAEDLPVEVYPEGRDFGAFDRRMFAELATGLMSPNVTLNRAETEERKARARSDVLPVVRSIKKGQVIIPEGSEVLPLQKSILNEIELQRSDRNRRFISLFASLLFMMLLLVSFAYLKRFTLNKVKVDGKDMAIMGSVALLVIALSKIFVFLTNQSLNTAFGLSIPDAAFLLAAPLAAGPMLVGLLIVSGEVVWIFTLFLSLAVGLLADGAFSVMMVSMIGGLAAARSVFGCKSRSELYAAGLKTGLVNAAVIVLMMTIMHIGDEAYLRQLLWAVPAGLLGGLISALVALMLVPLLESVFNVTTDVKLLELSNLNHPLLKEMIVRAPGTYHHSLVVGSMVEAAAEEIGANPLLAKVMSYYHDIGKTAHAGYFIENQKSGQNPHDHLSPYMSKTILVAHVKDGVELGLEHKLGKPIIDGIVQHHGTTLIAFFYNRALESQDESMGEVVEEEFRYPGPKPQFREAALIMLADSIEAAARSLDEPTPARLQNIVRNIIQRKFMDGQLDECNLNLRDLTTIEESFIRILHGIYHQRIDYPRRAGGGAADSPQLEKTAPTGRA
jgi:hypothetical protein